MENELTVHQLPADWQEIGALPPASAYNHFPKRPAHLELPDGYEPLVIGGRTTHEGRRPDGSLSGCAYEFWVNRELPACIAISYSILE